LKTAGSERGAGCGQNETYKSHFGGSEMPVFGLKHPGPKWANT
jgi:hypothetical protein